jgi:hypothetical protein
VENDEALGQLLDFISSKQVQPQGQALGDRKMTIVD